MRNARIVRIALPDALLERLEEYARSRGLTLEEALVEALERLVSRGKTRKPRRLGTPPNRWPGWSATP